MSDVSANLHETTKAVGETSRGAQASAAAAHELSALAEDLRRVVSQFKVA
jgi:methyl-accepting chemotaxis protein